MNLAIDLSIMLRAHYYISLKITQGGDPDAAKFYKQFAHSLNGVVFDLGREFEIGQPIVCVDSYPSFRHTIFPDYKAQREVDQKFLDLRSAVMPWIERDFYCLKLDDLEADDLLSLIAQEGPTIIVTRDQDLLQSCAESVLYDFKKKTFTHCDNPSGELEKKVIQGCKGDNVPKLSSGWGTDEYQFNYNLVAHDKVVYELFVPNFQSKLICLQKMVQECSFRG